MDHTGPTLRLGGVPTAPPGYSFNPQCWYPAKQECSGNSGGCCTLAGVGFGLACAGRSGSGSTSSREKTSSDLRTVAVFMDGDLVVMEVMTSSELPAKEDRDE